MGKKPNPPIPEKLYYKIGEVSQITGVEPYILRYWEAEFKIVTPGRTNSRQRLYRRKDLDLILRIKRLLYEERYTIAGAKKKLQRERAERERQLKLEFPEKRYREALLRLKRELEDLRGLLG